VSHAKWGINVATPAAALHIDEAYNHQGVLRVTNGNQGAGYYHQLEMSGTQNIFALWRHFDGSNFYNTHAHGSTGHIWYINGSEKLRVHSNGNVGIGSDNPNRPLSIGAGDGTVALHGGNAGIYIGTHPTGGFQNNCAIARAGANNYHISGSSVGDLCIAGESTKDIIIGTSVSAGAMNERMRFHHDGMVEITGTGSNLALNVSGGYIRSVGGQPTVVAHKSSSTFCHIGVENNTNARAFLAYTNDKDFIIGRRTAYTGDHTGYSGQDITIDKTNHAVALHYNGSQKFTTASDGISVAGSIYNSSSVNSTGDKGIQMGNGHRLGFDQSGTRSWTIKPTGGNLTFNSGDGGGTHYFYTNVTSSGSIDSASDIKLKTNIKTIDNALDKVLQLRGVEFDRVDSEDHQIGVIAQEVEKIIPEVVHGDDTKTVSYGNLVGLLIEAIKEQNVEINNLKKIVKNLES
jgi:hypothetical protein